jgi:raffinose/stachyose/melibiose transport system substrate-binding protein
MKKLSLAAAAVAASLSLAACGAGTSGGTTPGDVNPSGQIEPRAISWLLSRPANGSVITVMKELADEYGKSHPGFSLNFITTPDRPSYIQKYETLAAAKKLPELFDTDATPFAQKLAKQGQMVDAEKLLKDVGLYSNYRPSALDYQRFDDGSLYMLPFEYGAEYFWYNKALFAKAGIEVPKSLDDFPAMCTALAKTGVTPIAMAGKEQWPLERFMAYQPFRMEGSDYITKLKKGEAKFSDPAGQKAATWLSDLGKSGCFAKGFSSVGYTDAENLFTAGTAAVYNMGTWELPALATDKVPADIRNDIDFFTLPTITGGKTGANDYVAPSGIGMAVNAKTYDPLVRDFLKFALTAYPKKYAESGALAPTKDKVTVPSNATPLYEEALTTADSAGKLAMPWDTQLDPTTNTKLQQELVLLVQGDVTPDQFISTMDTSLSQNAPKFFN